MGYGRGLVYRLLNLFFVFNNFLNTHLRLMFSGLKRQTYVYAKRGNRNLKLDMYRPAETGERAPVIIYLHGGGWRVGYRKMIEPAFFEQVKRGYALVSVTYTFANKMPWPAQIHEVKAAIRWVRANADVYGFDPDKIVITGASAGGHLACVAGLSGNGLLEGGLGNNEHSSDVCAMIAYYPPADLRQLSEQGWIANRSIRELIGGPIDAKADNLKSATPMTYARADAPPLYLMHGTADHVVPYPHALSLSEAITTSGGRVELITLENHGHADWRFNFDEHRRGLEAFLDRETGHIYVSA